MLAPCPPLRGDVMCPAPPFLDPLRDLAYVGARLDAELGGEYTAVFVRVAFVEADLHPRELGQQIASPGCQFG